MLKYFSFISILLIVVIFSCVFAYPQETDIVPYLKQIEAGKRLEVNKEIPALQKQFPNDPSILFLQGVLTENGQRAANIYKSILKNYPGSRYADASVYRLYTYYFALGNYSKAKSYLDMLKVEYPQSPYISIAKRNVPDKNSILFNDNSNKNELKESASGSGEEDYKYTIQAGAFTVLDNAKALMSELKNAGYFSSVEDKLVGGTNFHVVYVGKFVNEDDAQNFLKQVNSKYNINGAVVKFDLQNQK